jgi:hypothetical protein
MANSSYARTGTHPERWTIDGVMLGSQQLEFVEDEYTTVEHLSR